MYVCVHVCVCLCACVYMCMPVCTTPATVHGNQLNAHVCKYNVNYIAYIYMHTHARIY